MSDGNTYTKGRKARMKEDSTLSEKFFKYNDIIRTDYPLFVTIVDKIYLSYILAILLPILMLSLPIIKSALIFTFKWALISNILIFTYIIVKEEWKRQK